MSEIMRKFAKVRDMAMETFGSIDLLVNIAGGAETRCYHQYQLHYR